MAIACLRLLTLPALPPGPLLSSPCLNSCMTLPAVFRWLGVDLAMALPPYIPGSKHPLGKVVAAVRRSGRFGLLMRLRYRCKGIPHTQPSGLNSIYSGLLHSLNANLASGGRSVGYHSAVRGPGPASLHPSNEPGPQTLIPCPWSPEGHRHFRSACLTMRAAFAFIFMHPSARALEAFETLRTS